MAVGGGPANRGRGGGEGYGKAVRGCFFITVKIYFYVFFKIRKLTFLTSMKRL